MRPTTLGRRALARLLAVAAAPAALGGGPAGASAAEPPAPERLLHLDRLRFAGAPDAALDLYEREAVWRRAAIAGVNTTAGGDLLLTVPRWLDARVPASLVRVERRGAEAVLMPWPDAAAHDLGNPRALRSVLGLQKDSRGRLWALDMGWVAGEEGAPPRGGPKLVAFDAATGAERARLPLDGVTSAGSFLNDVAVDVGRDLAFISDSGVRGAPANPTAILVVDLATGAARRVLERDPSTANDPSIPLSASGEAVFPGNPLQVGINGIALSPDAEWLYWGLTTGDGVFAAPAALLRDPNTPPAALAAAVRRIARPGAIDGMAVDGEGRILVAGLAAGAVLRIRPATGEVERIAAPAGAVWPDSLAWDPEGGLLFTVNRLNRVFAGTADFAPGSATFEVWRLPPGAAR